MKVASVVDALRVQFRVYEPSLMWFMLDGNIADMKWEGQILRVTRRNGTVGDYKFDRKKDTWYRRTGKKWVKMT
jgi:NAD kinase